MKLGTRKAVVNGCKIRYLTGGEGRPLLFLHGWPTAPVAYSESLEILADCFKVYAPYLFDLKCSSVEETAESVKALARQLGMKAAFIAGISFGGAVAAIIGRDAKAVSRLVLIGPAGVPRQASLTKMLTNLVLGSAQLTLQGRIRTAFYRWASLLSFLASLHRNYKRQLFREIKSSTKTHCCYGFQQIQAKTTIIWCAKDDVFPVSAAAILGKMIRHSRLITVDGDHYWPFHKPRAFAETIISALK